MRGPRWACPPGFFPPPARRAHPASAAAYPDAGRHLHLLLLLLVGVRHHLYRMRVRVRRRRPLCLALRGIVPSRRRQRRVCVLRLAKVQQQLVRHPCRGGEGGRGRRRIRVGVEVGVGQAARPSRVQFEARKTTVTRTVVYPRRYDGAQWHAWRRGRTREIAGYRDPWCESAGLRSAHNTRGGAATLSRRLRNIQDPEYGDVNKKNAA
ncbi:hypothetical protein B0H14DRAFT_2828727 [Mycena olivaceomarginata]|nr:hypothetical protein B0H14DRAFT_2828727 [Mycena olivaceomarginata]